MTSYFSIFKATLINLPTPVGSCLVCHANPSPAVARVPPKGMDPRRNEDERSVHGGSLTQAKDAWWRIYEAAPCEYITLIWHWAQVPNQIDPLALPAGRDAGSF